MPPIMMITPINNIFCAWFITVSPRIAELYAGKTERAIRRDVNDLLKMDLLKRSPKGFEVNRQKIRAFLPARKMN